MYRQLAIVALLPLSALSCKTRTYNAQIHTVAAGDATHWQTNDIPVCWENYGSATAEMRNRLREYVMQQFNQTNVRFLGWKTCSTDAKGIRIFIYDDPDNTSDSGLTALKQELDEISKNIAPGHPRAQRFGRELDGVKAGVVLSFRFTNVDGSLAKMAANLTAEGSINLLDSIALHELGHAIGLLHEDAHPEKTCDTYAEPLMDGKVVSPYVADSAMNRCFYRNLNYASEKLKLSTGDIKGINTLYKR